MLYCFLAVWFATEGNECHVAGQAYLCTGFEKPDICEHFIFKIFLSMNWSEHACNCCDPWKP